MEMQASHMPHKAGSLLGNKKNPAASMETARTRLHMRIVVGDLERERVFQLMRIRENLHWRQQASADHRHRVAPLSAA
jgi:hypothetical protein